MKIRGLRCFFIVLKGRKKNERDRSEHARGLLKRRALISYQNDTFLISNDYSHYFVGHSLFLKFTNVAL